ncbi:MAG TPA: NYN domain-containing protein [Quisquiliibacterium sp.]|nr:NYN domain-containing protein [Quisquiliibacterium sp.]
MAVFCDFENVALGVKDARYSQFDISKVLERLLLKGSIVVKKAYCDWERYREFKAAMHQASFELIEIPHVRQSGKNSADIRMVVDALDLCYTKSHVDTFVIISGDSDFSPLVSKLRENAKTVIGVGVKNSTSDLLIANCDEFIYYDDLVRGQPPARGSRASSRGGAAKAQPAKGEAQKAEAAAPAASRGAQAKGEAGKNDPGRGDAGRNEAAKGDAAKGDAAKGDAAKGDGSQRPAGRKSAGGRGRGRMAEAEAPAVPEGALATPGFADEPAPAEAVVAAGAVAGADAAAGAEAVDSGSSPEDRAQQAIDLVVDTIEALADERGEDEKIWGSMVKQTLKRRRPGFNEAYYGYRSFNALLEEARDRGLIGLERDEKSGGYTVRSLL